MPRILVIGCGSIGERHIRNLLSLNQEVWVYDKDLTRVSEMIEKYKVGVFDFKGQHIKMDAFVIATPPNYHALFALVAVDHNAHMFIEKPLSNNMNFISELEIGIKEKNLICMVGYQMRFHPTLRTIRSMIKGGKTACISAEFGKYLPDWHSGEDYRGLYTSHESEGGGVVLDASHEIDYVRWLVGEEVIKVACFCDKLSPLEIDTEDTAEIILKFTKGTVGRIHLDMISRKSFRRCKVVSSEGEERVWNIQNDEFSWDDLYVKEMKHFLECIHEGVNPVIDLGEGKRVLEIALADKESSKTGKIVHLGSQQNGV